MASMESASSGQSFQTFTCSEFARYVNGLFSCRKKLCTGHLGGVIKLLEDELGFSLQWIICLLHCNELQMKALIKFLDGETKSGNTWKGEVMMEVMACQSDGFRQVISYKK